MQWISQYLWFLPLDPTAAKSRYYSSLIRLLARLHPSLSLTAAGAQTGSVDRGPAKASAAGRSSDELRPRITSLQVCMRSVLESLWARLGALPELSHEEGGDFTAARDVLVTTLDPRLIQLCCPLLNQARLALQVVRPLHGASKFTLALARLFATRAYIWSQPICNQQCLIFSNWWISSSVSVIEAISCARLPFS